MAEYVAGAGDEVWDPRKRKFGRVVNTASETCRIVDAIGAVEWTAKRYQLQRAVDATDDEAPKGYVPVPVTPANVLLHDLLFMGGRFYPVEDLRQNGAGGRMVRLKGWPGGWWVMARAMTAYRSAAAVLQRH